MAEVERLSEGALGREKVAALLGKAFPLVDVPAVRPVVIACLNASPDIPNHLLDKVRPVRSIG